MDPFDALRRDVSYLGRVLGDTLVEQVGKDLFDLEETIRALAKDRRAAAGPTASEPDARLRAIVRQLDTTTAEQVARAFTHYFQLVNLAEQHHRTRRRRHYAKEGKAQPGSLEETFLRLKSTRPPAGEPTQALASLLATTTIELVFTAHPSEAQRRTVLEKHRRLVARLVERDSLERGVWESPGTPAEINEIDALIREEVTELWQTDEIRHAKPRVGDEVKNVLFYLEESLFPLIPKVYAAIERASGGMDIPCVLQFGSWVGADMDGNPNVTPAIAVDTALAQSAHVLDLYIQQVSALAATLSQSTRRVTVSPELVRSIERDAQEMPELAHALEDKTDREPYRRKLTFVAERLARTRAEVLTLRGRASGSKPPVAPHAATTARYASVAEFLADLEVMHASLVANRGKRAGASRVRALMRQAETFGFHLARLDVRIPAEWVRADARALLGLPADAPLTMEILEEAARQRKTTEEKLASDGQALQAIRAIARIRAIAFGGAEALILSMTRGAEDMLATLLLIEHVRADPADVSIVPLFETLDDLERSSVELDRAASSPIYAAYLAKRERAQEVMVGYSDSNKDAGIVGSSFALYRAQQRLAETAKKHRLRLTIFHGRGGSIGRGGGPSQRAIESLPPGAVDGRFKLTEQGEVLGWKYLVPEIAERNLELVIAGVLLQSSRWAPEAKDATREHEEAFEEIARVSVDHYRALVNDPDFATYYAATTPIAEIPRLNIGSRPAKRPAKGTQGDRMKLDDLRAIPWVFAWTQSRQMVPGFYGAGKALSLLVRKHGVERVRKMRREWPFFASTLDAIAVSLAQADMAIAARYADLMHDEDPVVARRLFTRIALDHGRAVRAIRTIFDRTEGSGPLHPASTLARSIELRNPYVDPLSIIQIELVRRKRALQREGREVPPELERAILLTINGIAAGLRSTG